MCIIFVFNFVVANQQPVAFSAELSTSLTHPSAGMSIVFDKVQFNSGNFYNNKTGTFYCPTSGVYYFSLELSSSAHPPKWSLTARKDYKEWLSYIHHYPWQWQSPVIFTKNILSDNTTGTRWRNFRSNQLRRWRYHSYRWRPPFNFLWFSCAKNTINNRSNTLNLS